MLMLEIRDSGASASKAPVVVFHSCNFRSKLTDAKILSSEEKSSTTQIISPSDPIFKRLTPVAVSIKVIAPSKLAKAIVFPSWEVATLVMRELVALGVTERRLLE